MLDQEGRALRAELLGSFHHDAGQPLDDDAFDRLARRMFSFQFRRNGPYGAYCRRRGIEPDVVRHWTEIPPVPTAAFKEVDLISGDAAAAEAVFRTSGTTRGPERRGRHLIADLSIYHASLLAGFAAYVLPDGAELATISLVPPSAELPDSSLAHMVSVVSDRLGSRDSACFAGVDSGVDTEGLERALLDLRATDSPVCILGTTAAFLHWLDRLREAGRRHELPNGSRLMDTGGNKGGGREVPEAELLEAYADRLGIDADYRVNEYGMTELCSQFYDNTLRDRVLGRAATPRRKRPPPWVRTRVVDPDRLEPVAPGEVGILQHCDLANLGSVVMVQTEDLGRQLDDGFVVLGRATGAPPRGCSIAMDLLLRSAEAENPS